MVSLTLPTNARGPVLDLALPASEQAIDIILRNKTTGESLTLVLPEEWDGTDLSLDFRRRTILDASGADRSSLLDPTDLGLWTPEPLIAGANNVEIEALGAALVAKDDFNQTAGAVAGKALETGGNWEGEGDADDFAVVAGAEHVLRRSALSDEVRKGRLIKASTPTVAATRVIADFFASAELASGQLVLAGPCARILAGGYRLELNFQWNRVGEEQNLYLFLLLREEAIPGSKFTLIAEGGPYANLRKALTASRVRTVLDVVGGEATAKVFALNNPSEVITLSGKHTWLEGKGTKDMSSGKVGLYDEQRQATAPTRSFDRFRAYNLAGKGSYAAKATLRWEKGYY